MVISASINNEEELLAKIAAGDEHAFAILFNRYQRDVFVHSKRIAQSEEQALDAVQNIFIKVWVNRTTLSEVTNFGGYLNRIVRNYSFDLLKQLAKESDSSFKFQQTKTEIDESTGQLLDYKEAVNILEKALDELPTQQKMAYKLCHQDGLKYEDAAAQMNISTDTLKAHMKHALRKIRQHLNNHGIYYAVLVIAMQK
ncbi:ECF RNA polymerase sigma-E factor [compost metagenome]